MIRKRIAILGSTGSIGTQTLEVIQEHPELFEAKVLSCGRNVELLVAQAKRFLPAVVVVADEQKYTTVRDALDGYNIEVMAGEDALEDVVQRDDVDILLAAIVGFAGLKSTIAAIKANKHIALANKETLVVAGELVMELAASHKVHILPVDSEHSAIFQCLEGESFESLEKIYLTASGGPFRGMKRTVLEKVSPEQALKHPNWSMGKKITIDSASLMNKGLEVIEAKWLFDLTIDQIDVIIHPQSIIHSLVQFCDGSLKAQMGLPDMKLPIQYAIGYPKRIKNTFERFNFLDHKRFDFELPDKESFPNLALAYDALLSGGNMSCALNAANEVAVAAFLNKEIGFLQMSDVIFNTMSKITYIKKPSLNDYLETDTLSRVTAGEFVTTKKKIHLI